MVNPGITLQSMVRGAIFFDVDGTLVPGPSSSQHLASFLAHLPACEVLKMPTLRAR
jgi:hypothetical protein